MTLQARGRRVKLATFLVRVAAFFGSVRLAEFAVSLIRFEYRVDKGKWVNIPLDIDVRKIAQGV